MCTSDGWKRLVRMYLFEMWQQWFFESTTKPAQMAFEWIGYGLFIDTAEPLIWHHFIGPSWCCCCSGWKIWFNLHFSNGHRWYDLNLCCFYGFIYVKLMVFASLFIGLLDWFGNNIKMFSARLLLFMRCCIKCCLN